MSEATTMGDAAAGATAPRRIWDVPTRAFHWLLVLSIAASWATAEVDLPDLPLPWKAQGSTTVQASLTRMQIHLLLGYWTMGLIAFRVVWGVVGSRHARFLSFLKGPVTIWRYFRSLFGKGHVETAGHNPMGGWMVIVLLVLVARQVYTGLFTADDIISCGVNQGPWAKTLPLDQQKPMRLLHGDNFDLLLIAIGVHVAAIAIYALAYRLNLVGPMLTGRKAALRAGEGEAIAGTPWLRFIGAALLATLFAWWIVTTGEHATAACVPVDDFM